MFQESIGVSNLNYTVDNVNGDDVDLDDKTLKDPEQKGNWMFIFDIYLQAALE